MDQKILDAFYKEILPQANSKNMVSIGDFLFDASFCLSSRIEDISDENIKDVSVSSIVALTLFTSFLQDISCNEMIVKSNFPIRNMAKMNNSRVPYDEFVRICNNTINKYYRNFRRLSYHFPELEITSYPYELDNSMHI